MIRALVAHWVLLSLACSAVVGTLGLQAYPFPGTHPLLGLIDVYRPAVFAGFAYTYAALWFSSPFIVASIVFSLLYIFVARWDRNADASGAAAVSAGGTARGPVRGPRRAAPRDAPGARERPHLARHSGARALHRHAHRRRHWLYEHVISVVKLRAKIADGERVFSIPNPTRRGQAGVRVDVGPECVDVGP